MRLMATPRLNTKKRNFDAPPAPPFFRAVSPDNRWSVTVEVEPSSKEYPGEWYSCYLTLDGETVLESLVTDNQEKMLRWTKRQMENAMRRCVRA